MGCFDPTDVGKATGLRARSIQDGWSGPLDGKV